VLLLAPEAEDAERLTRLLAGFGGRVDHEAEFYGALSAILDDPRGWDLFVISCDALGGIEAGRRAMRMLGGIAERVPTILVSEECEAQTFPEERAEPILLRARMSAAALRLAMEHALRGRMALRFG
jgi:hypothetical protein